MARKMKTMDGNHAAAHASYAYYRCCSYLSRLPRHLLWRKQQMSGQHREERTSSDRPYRLQRCSLRLVQQVLFTDLWQQVL